MAALAIVGGHTAANAQLVRPAPTYRPAPIVRQVPAPVLPHAPIFQQAPHATTLSIAPAPRSQAVTHNGLAPNPFVGAITGPHAAPSVGVAPMTPTGAPSNNAFSTVLRKPSSPLSLGSSAASETTYHAPNNSVSSNPFGSVLSPTVPRSSLLGTNWTQPINVSVANVSAKPVSYLGTQAGTPLGTMTVNVPGKGQIKLTSYSNGANQGTVRGPEQYQCVTLVKDYAGELGLKKAAGGSLGAGKDAAQNLANQSDGKFKFFGGATATAPPTVGSVVSIDTGDSSGHVGIAQSVTSIGANEYRVTLFDQNWRNGGSWKTLDFSKSGNTWVGTMSDNGTSVYASGWANPSF